MLTVYTVFDEIEQEDVKIAKDTSRVSTWSHCSQILQIGIDNNNPQFRSRHCTGSLWEGQCSATTRSACSVVDLWNLLRVSGPWVRS